MPRREVLRTWFLRQERVAAGPRSDVDLGGSHLGSSRGPDFQARSIREGRASG